MPDSRSLRPVIQKEEGEQNLSARARRSYARIERPLYGIGGVVAFFLLWEYVGTSGLINPLFTSAPSKIGYAGLRMFCAPPEFMRASVKSFCPAEIRPDLTSQIWNDLYISGTEFFVGFGLAILVGIPFGLLMGWYARFNYIFEPFVNALNATPRVALMPLIIIWLGLGIWSKVLIVFLGGIFPIIINTQSGVRALDDVWLRAARSFGANDRQIFRTIALPGSIPFILAGIRVGLGRGLVGIVVGELVGATAGVGHAMAIAGATFQTDKLFVGLFLLLTFGVVVTNVVNRLERRFEAWRPQRT